MVINHLLNGMILQVGIQSPSEDGNWNLNLSNENKLLLLYFPW